MSEANGTAPIVRRPALAGYRPHVLGAALATDMLDGQPIFTWRWLESMRRDPQVQFGLRILRAPLAQVKVKVQAKSQRVGHFVHEQWRRVWQRSLGKITRMFEAGFSAGEVCYRREGRAAVFDRLINVHYRDAQPLEYSRGRRRGELAGVRVSQSGDVGEVDLRSPHSFWCTNDPDYDQLWGQSRLRTAFAPWREKRGKHGALDSRRLFYHKCAFTGGQLRYPPGVTDIGDEDSGPIYKSNQDIAREILEKFENGGVLALPNTRDKVSNEFLWIFEPAKINTQGSETLLEYPKELDREILKGLGIPPELVEAATVGSGYSGRAIPAQVFFSSLDEAAFQIIEAIDRCILRWLVEVNFGRGQHYEIEHESLAELVAREPQKIHETQRDDLDDPLGATLAAASGQPVRMSVGEIGRYLKIRERVRRLAEKRYPDLAGWERNGDGNWVRALLSQRKRSSIRLAVKRAPKGGIQVQGNFYPGGQFIPGEVLARATPAELAAIEGTKELPKTQKADEPERTAKRSSRHAQTRKSLNQTPIKSQKKLGGGCNVTELVELEDGRKGVWKPSNGEEENLRTGIDAGTYYRREIAASRVAEILGFDDLVPTTERRENSGVAGSIQLFAPNAAIAESLDYPWDGATNAARAAVFDYLIGHEDRHRGNWLVGGESDTEEKIVLIDNGLAFPHSYHNDDFFNFEFWRRASYKGFPIPDVSKWADKWPEIEAVLAEEGIEPEAIELTKQRFAAIVQAQPKTKISDLPAIVAKFGTLGNMVKKLTL